MAAFLLLLGLLLSQEPIPQSTAPTQESLWPALPAGLPRRDQASVLLPLDPALEPRVRFVYWPGDEERAARLLAALERAPYLPGLPPDMPGRSAFYLAPDMEIWNALTGGAVPSWGAGVAIPAERIAVIPLDGGPLSGLAARDRTALHEWAHLGLHDYLGGMRIPRWFDEGYAQWASAGWDVEEAWRLRVALARGGTPPLDSLALAWPVDRVGADLAYLLSASAVEYLVGESGERGMEIFLTRWRALGDFEEAFRQTFGFTTSGFELRWVEHVKRRYGWMLVLYQTAPFWLLGGVALLFLFGVRRRRDRERLAGLRANDPPDQPAYWTSEVDRSGEGG
ncbi:MAG: hypothetical protein WEG36_13150 [Gemmatimonadota bacterium]